MKRKTYPTDLSDEQWKLLESMLPPPELLGRKRSVNLRAVFNARVLFDSFGLSMAIVAERVSEMANRLLLFSAVARC
jgi:hypothetical protein